ncbi:hypothetical protein ACFLVN_04765 [Chloroflexota bacterium]
MKKQELIKKQIEEQVKKYKSRADVGRGDAKRHDLVKLDEIKSMRIVRKRLGWSHKKIGSVFERDWRTVKRVIETHETQETTKVEKEIKPETCQAPPDNIDVTMLKKWRVPSKKAPGLLYEWRSCHREGSHDKCCSYQNLIDDLTVKGILFEEAEALLNEELTAKYLDSEIIQRTVDLARIYRPWENKDNWEICLKELREL